MWGRGGTLPSRRVVHEEYTFDGTIEVVSSHPHLVVVGWTGLNLTPLRFEVGVWDIPVL